MSEKKELPMGWIPTTLGEIAEVIMGQSPSSETYNTVGAGLPFFQGKAEFTDLHPVAEKWCSRPNKIAIRDDVLLSVRAPVGATNVADRECCIGRGLAAIRYQHNHRFINYFLRLAERDLDEKGTGTTFRTISGEVVRNTEFMLPPLPEQHRIVAKIEELFSSLDKGIEDLKTAQQQLNIYRQAVLKWAFEGRLTNRNVADGELPEEWRAVRIGDRTKCIVPNRDKPKSFSGNIKWVTTPNLSQSSIRLDYEGIPLGLTQDETIRYHARVVPAGSVIMTCVGTFGLSAVVERPIVINQQLHAFLGSADIDPKYLAYCIRYNRQFFDEKSTSTTISYLNKENCNSMPLPLCSLPEQAAIVSEIESRLSVCDKIEETIADSLKQAESLRQSILKKAFEGKLVPQDPNDEPASVLLARIKADREKNSREKERTGAARKTAKKAPSPRPLPRGERDERDGS
jgi:type I restriction enzyme, S subunit